MTPAAPVTMDLKQVLDLTPRTLRSLNQRSSEDSLVDVQQAQQIFDLFDKVPVDCREKVRSLTSKCSSGRRRLNSYPGAGDCHESPGLLPEGDRHR